MGDVPGKPQLSRGPEANGSQAVAAQHPTLGDYTLYAEDAPELLFTENESNRERLFGVPNPTPFVKDAFHRYLIQGEASAVNPAQTGSKAAAHYHLGLGHRSGQELAKRGGRW